MFFLMIVGLYTSRVVLQALGVVDFGIYGVVGGVVSSLAVFSNSLAVSTQRYLTFQMGKGDEEKLKRVFIICFSLYILLAICVFLLSETIGVWFVNTQLTIPQERMFATNCVFQCTIFSCIFHFLIAPYMSVIISYERMDVYAYIGIVEVTIKLLLVFLLEVFDFDHLIFYAVLMALAECLHFLCYYIFCNRKFSICHYRWIWDKSLFKELLSYSAWNVFGSLSGMFKNQGVSILLNVFFSPIVNAAREIAMQVNLAIHKFFTNFYTAVRPQITKYYAIEDYNNMFKLVFRSSKLSFFLILFLSLPIILEAPFLIDLWLGSIPEYTVEFVRLIVVVTAIDAMANPLMTSCHATGKVRLYQFVVGTITMTTLPIAYVMLKWFEASPVDIYFLSIGISLVNLFVRLFLVKRLILNFPVKRYIKDVFCRSFLVAIVAFVFPFVVSQQMEIGWLEFLVVGCLSVLCAFFSIFSIGMTSNERQWIKIVFLSKIRK